MPAQRPWIMSVDVALDNIGEEMARQVRQAFMPDLPRRTEALCAVCGNVRARGQQFLDVGLCGDHAWIFRAAGPKGLYDQVSAEVRTPANMDGRKMRARERRLDKYLTVLTRMVAAERTLWAQEQQDAAKRDAVEFD